MTSSRTNTWFVITEREMGTKKKIKKTRTLIVPIDLFSILFFGFSCAIGQSTQDSPVKLGIKAAPNMSWMAPETKHYNYDGLTGAATIGLIADFYFAKNYAFSTGFNFAFLNGRLTYADSLSYDTTTSFGTMSRKYKFFYLDIPYMIKLRTNPFGKFSFFGQIGFSTGFRMSAKTRETFEPEGGGDPIEENININSETTLIRQAVLFGIGLEYNLAENTRIILGVNYSNALNNVLKGHNKHTDFNQKALLNFVELNLGVLF